MTPVWVDHASLSAFHLTKARIYAMFCPPAPLSILFRTNSVKRMIMIHAIWMSPAGWLRSVVYKIQNTNMTLKAQQQIQLERVHLGTGVGDHGRVNTKSEVNNTKPFGADTRSPSRIFMPSWSCRHVSLPSFRWWSRRNRTSHIQLSVSVTIDSTCVGR